MIPQVKFEVGKVEDYTASLKYFILENKMFIEAFHKKYPSLFSGLEKAKNKESYIEKYFEKQEKKFLPVMIKVREDFEKLWDCNDKIMKALEEINEIKWSDKHKNFTVRITLNPVAPRYLDKNCFDIFFGLPNSLFKTLVLHEISHFIFFEKLKKIYPKINEQEFQSPNLIWKLSEIIPGVVLRDEKITRIFELNEVALVYPFINNIWINNKKLLDILQEFYDSKKDFTDFVKKSYDFLKLNEEEINKHFG